MAKYWLFLICLVTLVGANTDGISEFSNNLASDLGPLLALFGESMTRQYLSESTSFLDYFIFAMAPIGILTTIVSTIRVCGSPSLRAFIGRSQEGDGVVEAELCTSTSHDVCELFNKGGITRVLGRPHILELIFIPPQSASEKTSPTRDSTPDKTSKTNDAVPLYLCRDYFGGAIGNAQPSGSGWSKARHNWPFASDLGGPEIAPRPNLSLNVGIKRRSTCVFSAIAIIGLVLQAGVVAQAGISVWILGWNPNNAKTLAARNYALVMFITGTVLMCGGMWSCAALIGETTKEQRFTRKREDASKSHLYWLQAGKQDVGGQHFDSFAYVNRINDKTNNTDKDPLLYWTSSKKDLGKKFKLRTYAAVAAVLAGYIMQFIGLRGMKSAVSLAQLGVTIFMSVLRGLLRVQRLGRDENKLVPSSVPDELDRIAGHELDWLAFEIALPGSHKEPSWHIVGIPDWREDARGAQLEHLFRIRERLAHLTGNNPPLIHPPLLVEKWDDAYVKVRVKARQLSAAICLALAAPKLIPKYPQLKLQVALDKSVAANSSVQLIEVNLKSPPQTDWNIDTAKIEAILGLWTWTLIKQERTAGKVPLARIVSSAGPEDWNAEANNRELNF